MKKLTFLIITFLLNSCLTDNSKTSVGSSKGIINEEIIVIGQELPSKPEKNLEFTLVEHTSIDLNGNGKADTIILEKISKWIKDGKNDYYWNDPGEYHRICIILDDGTKKCFFNIDGWINKNNLLTYDENIGNEDCITSKNIIVLKCNDTNSLILCTGYVYASTPGLLTIISINKGKSINLIFNKEAELFGFKDLNDDGIKDLITTVWEGYYNSPEENKYRFKVYTMKEGFTFNQEYSKQIVDNPDFF